MAALGGWRRLWILVGVLYGFALAMFAWSTSADAPIDPVPRHSNVDPERAPLTASDLVDIARDPTFDLFDPDHRDLLTDEEVRGLVEVRGGFTDKELLVLADDSRFRPFSWEDRRLLTLRELLRVLVTRASSAVALVVRWWLVPMLTLYAFGWSVGWVLRGFRTQNKQRI